MEHEGGGLQPWQVFTAMFVGFWAISAYFDHFLLTGVFCIAFGVLGEIMTKMIYGENIGKNLEIQKEELKRLLEIVEKEKTQPEEDELFEIQQNIVHQEEILCIKTDKEIRTQILEQEEEDEEEDKEEEEENEMENQEEEDEPPPLPTRDYETEKIEFDDMSIEHRISDNDNVDGTIPITEVIEDAEEDGLPLDDQEDTRFDNMNGNTVQVGDILIPQADHYDETIENVEFEVTGETEFVGTDQAVHNDTVRLEMNGNEIQSDLDTKVTQTVNMDLLDVEHNENEVMSPHDGVEVIVNNVRPIEKDSENETTSLDPEEVYNSRESTRVVHEENTKGCESLEANLNIENLDQKSETVVVENGHNEEAKDISKNSDLVQAAVKTTDNPEIDIDLSDPAVEAAATKIQSAFKGFKIRKQIGKQ